MAHPKDGQDPPDTHLSSQNNVRNEPGDRTFKPRLQIGRPAVHRRSLRSLMDSLENGGLNLDPDYQREVVWTADRMSSLINSLMENFYIPPILLNVKEDPSTGQWIRECMDGKQRLSSVRAFVNGLISCRDAEDNKWWFQGDSRKYCLSEAEKTEFLDTKDFLVFEYTNLSLELKEDLFARVQMGVQLTLAEKLRASTGPWQDLTKKFEHDFPSLTALFNDGSRATEFRVFLACFSQILEVQYHYPTSNDTIPKLKTTHNSIPKLLENTAALDDATRSHLTAVFTTFQALVNEDPKIFMAGGSLLKGPQTFSPVEFLAVAVLISVHAVTRNHALLLEDIWSLRVFLREHHRELSIDRHVWASVWEFIHHIELYRGRVPGAPISPFPWPTAKAASTPTPKDPNTPPKKSSRSPRSMKHKLNSLTPRKDPPPALELKTTGILPAVSGEKSAGIGKESGRICIKRSVVPKKLPLRRKSSITTTGQLKGCLKSPLPPHTKTPTRPYSAATEHSKESRKASTLPETKTAARPHPAATGQPKEGGKVSTLPQKKDAGQPPPKLKKRTPVDPKAEGSIANPVCLDSSPSPPPHSRIAPQPNTTTIPLRILSSAIVNDDRKLPTPSRVSFLPNVADGRPPAVSSVTPPVPPQRQSSSSVTAPLVTTSPRSLGFPEPLPSLHQAAPGVAKPAPTVSTPIRTTSTISSPSDESPLREQLIYAASQTTPPRQSSTRPAKRSTYLLSPSVPPSAPQYHQPPKQLFRTHSADLNILGKSGSASIPVQPAKIRKVVDNKKRPAPNCLVSRPEKRRSIC